MAATHFRGPLVVNGVAAVAPVPVALTEATTLTAAQSGTTFVFDASSGATITLPALADGLTYTFVVARNFASSDWVIDSAEGDNITGNLIVNGAAVRASSEDQINFVNTAEALGDWITVTGISSSVASFWKVDGVGSGAGSITATDPS